MPATSYYATSLIMYGMVLLCAWFVTQLSLLINFVSAFSITFLSFWYPAFFFYSARKFHKKNVSPELQEKDVFRLNYTLSIWFNFLIGLVSFALGLYVSVLSLTKPSSH